MPHNNRMSVSASLNTTGIWAQTIGHDPYKGGDANDDDKKATRTTLQDEKALLEAAKKQSLSDGIQRDDLLVACIRD